MINLKAAPLEPDVHDEKESELATQQQQSAAVQVSQPHRSMVRFGDSGRHSLPTELPENLSLLFVDDDAILRRLFSRTVNRVAPTWKIREAASGEAALRLVEENNGICPFDLIFMDMYMVSGTFAFGWSSL